MSYIMTQNLINEKIRVALACGTYRPYKAHGLRLLF